MEHTWIRLCHRVSWRRCGCRHFIDDLPWHMLATEPVGTTVPVPCSDLVAHRHFRWRNRRRRRPVGDVGYHQGENLWLLMLLRYEVLFSIEPQQGCHIVGRPGWDKPELPATQRRGNPHRRQGVSHIVLAIAKRPLAIFPGLPPDDGTEANEK